VVFVHRSLIAGLLLISACAQPVKPPPPSPKKAPHKVDSLPAEVTATPVVPRAAAAAPATAKPAASPPHAAAASRTPVMLPSGSIATPVDPFARADRMEWPGPNRYRSASGQPGPDYWQQRADYDIAATLDTAEQRIEAKVTITYTNNSPDTLTFLWLQLDQNLYREGSLGSTLHSEETRWGARGYRGGYDIKNLSVNGKPALPVIDDTRMRVKLASPLVPHGGRVTVAMDYDFRVPNHGSDRMGRDGRLFEIAQWYPRMAVYDDVRGWNTDPYYGQGEFYLEYGDIDYAVTAPAGYTIAGSGVLQNAAEVLTPAQRSRLADAAHTDRIVPIIAAGEDAAVPRSGTRTWRFRAQNVRDVAWAGAPDFRWDATSWNGILMQAYYEIEKAGASWQRGAEWTRWSIRFYSQMVHPYPYPQATSVAGPVGGMEYPMFVMVHYGKALSDTAAVFSTIDHEQGHEWFPMMVGSNERRYGWMDEGINTYINTFSHEAHGPDSTRWAEYMDEWQRAVLDGTQAPLMTPADRINPGALGAIAYRKPGAVMLALRNHVVGPATFDEAFREYARRWAFKHPTPGDFFRTIENVSGKDLAWYWSAFFYSDDVLDIGVDTAFTVISREGMRAVVRLSKHTSIPFPVEMRLKLADGSVRTVMFPVEIWTAGDRYDALIAVASPVTGVRLWPDPTVPDWEPANDVWGDAPPANPNARSAAASSIAPVSP
jgi:hypothetical protein